MDNPDRQLVILHATDIHLAYDNVARLKEWLRAKKQRVDVVFLSGDIANVPVETAANGGPAEVFEEHHCHLKKIMEEFSSTCVKVYYLPGNHDVPAEFKTDASEAASDFPCNVHLRHTTIAPGLHLIGLGGSVPGYTIDGKHVWDGYPYTSDERMNSDLTKLLDPIFHCNSSPLKPSDAVLFMTHCGPDKCNTTFVREDPSNPILGGSPSLYKHLCDKELQRHVVMNIHGHTHDSPGRVTIGNTVVINPGPLQDGFFGIYTLQMRGAEGNVWGVSSTSFHRL